MENSGFCVIDVGTGGGKCLVFDENGYLAFNESIAVNYLIDGKAMSFDPKEVWGDICGMIRRAGRECSKKKTKIITISSTSMREGNVFYDTEGNELLAVPNLDERAQKEAEEIGESLGDEIYLSSGHWPTSIFLVNRLKFLKKTRPVLFGEISKVSMINDWIL